MNKTLLIVICDFLLLSMLGMISFDDLPTKQEAPKDDLIVTPYADSQLVDLLRMSLDKEKENRDSLNSKVDEYSSRAKEIEDISKEQALELAKKQESLDALQTEKLEALDLIEQSKQANKTLEEEKAQSLAEAKELQSKLQSEISQKQALEADKQRSFENSKALEEKLKDEANQKLALAEKVGQMSESDAVLKARLLAMQEELERAKADVDSLSQEKASIQQKSEELSTQLEVEKTKASIYQEDLEKAKSLVMLEKNEKQQIQEHAQTLASGVDKLADNQTKLVESQGKLADSQTKIIDTQEKLAKQVDEMRPLTESEIYETYKANALNIDVSYKRTGVLNDSIETKTIRSAIIDVNGEYWTIFSTDDTPFDRAKNKFIAPENLEFTPWAKGLKFHLSALYSLKYHTNILAFKIPVAFVEKTGLKVYSFAQNPFKHEQATLVDTKDFYYGQLKYSVDEKYSGFAKVDSGFFSSLFGDFSPAAGDLVFDRSGSFLGIMTNSSNLSLVKNFAVSSPLPLLSRYTKDAARNFYENMKSGK
ncbi:MAG: hypothetical protein R3Y46_02200, partial [Opitutales bacterium]